jgi:hypothetical protein
MISEWKIENDVEGSCPDLILDTVSGFFQGLRITLFKIIGL